MALPLIAAGIVARAAAKKLATRAAGGITGAGAKQVAPVYREMGTGSVKVVKPISDTARAAKNAAETARVTNAKSGATSSLYSSIRSVSANINKSMGERTPKVKIKSK